MDVSSTQSAAVAAISAPLTALKTAREAQGKAALEVIEGVAEQTKETASVFPKIGQSLNVKV